MANFLDSLFQLRDDGNPTRIAMFQLAGISNNTTRTLTVQDRDGTIALLANPDNVFSIFGNVDSTKTLKFELGSSTALADLILDYRSAVDRSLIWNLSGGTGGNLQFNWAGTVSRTVTIPTTASFTIAGNQLANSFTRLQTITAGGTDARALQLNIDSGAQTQALKASDTSSGSDLMILDSDSGLNVLALTLWTGAASIGTGFSGSINNDTLTANRIWTFPNLTGKVLVAGATVNSASLSSSVGSTTLVASSGSQLWMIEAYLSVTTADAGGGAPNTVSITIGYTDAVGAQSVVIATRTLTTTGSTQGTLVLWVPSASNITYSTTYVASSSPQTLSTTTNGTTTLTSAALFGTLTAGMSITGTGIQANTIISSITNTSTLIMSLAATDSTTNNRNFDEVEVYQFYLRALNLG